MQNRYICDVCIAGATGSEEWQWLWQWLGGDCAPLKGCWPGIARVERGKLIGYISLSELWGLTVWVKFKLVCCGGRGQSLRAPSIHSSPSSIAQPQYSPHTLTTLGHYESRQAGFAQKFTQGNREWAGTGITRRCSLFRYETIRLTPTGCQICNISAAGPLI